MDLDLIVEIGNSHDGSLGIATSMVQMAHAAGAKTVKFQMHLAEFESSTNEPFRKQFSFQDESRFDYWKRVTFSYEQWTKLIDFTTSLGMEFMCSPFSVEAAEWLLFDGRIKRWKVGSGEATNYPLLDYLIETEKEILISTGLITWNELVELKARFEDRNAWDRVTLLHCVSMYPAPIEKVSLNVVHDLQTLTSKVGFSDHSGNLSVPLYAFAQGVSTVEVHLTPHKLFFGPDTTSSLTPEELRLLIEITKNWTILGANGLSRDDLFLDSESTAKIFRKGIYWKQKLPAGHKITLKDISFLKPSAAFSAKDYESLLGQSTLEEVNAGEPVLPSQVRFNQ